MTKAAKESRARLAVLLNSRSPSDPPSTVDSDIEIIVRLQARLHRLYLQACNGPELTDSDKAKRELLEKRLIEIADGYDLAIEFNDDPRGNPVFFHIPGLPEYKREPCNDIGGRGWAIW